MGVGARLAWRLAGVVFVLRSVAGVASVESSTASPSGAPPAVEVAQERVMQRESDWYVVVGGDDAQNRTVAGLCDGVIAQLESLGFSSEFFHGRKLVVRLQSGEGVSAPYLYPGDGDTVLDLPAGFAAAHPGEVCRALVRAFCHRLTRAAGRGGAPAPWLVAALSEEVLNSGNIAAVEAAARWARREGWIELARLESAFATETPTGRRASFWLYRALRRESRDRTAMAAEAMCGTGVSELRRRFFAPESDADADALWWPVAFHRLTGERADALVGSEVSEARYAELSRFVMEESGSDLAMDSEGLMARHDRANLRRAVSLRLLELKFELPRANPLWHNAYVAYGLFLEKFADPASDVATLRALAAQAASEAESARRLGAEARRTVAAMSAA